uniref:Nuclear pore complex protein Nup85 n=1 Tax=Timema genevievae TaxID=629358 RepID=A0A7R9JNG0_TIMGE|nr:unnamed protein product [Timema genevievae]
MRAEQTRKQTSDGIKRERDQLAGYLELPNKSAPHEAKVHEVRPDILLFDPMIRKLINESNGTFLEGQKLMAKATMSEARSDLLKMSKQYRAIIRACLENLQKELERASEPRKATLSSLVSIFYNVEFLWHLCEILYVDAVPGDIVLPQLLEWIRFHFFRCERRATAIIDTSYISMETEGNGAESEPEYWETMIGLVLQGQLEATRALLRLHSAAATEPFRSADFILKSMPTFSVYGRLTSTEFISRWKAWQRECSGKIQSGMFSARKPLQLIMKLLCGDKEAFSEVKGHCETWYQYMAAWLLYTEPTVKSFDLTFHAHQCIALFRGLDKLNSTDVIILALLEADLQKVIKLISTTMEKGWFAVHLTNLLYHCGCLNILDSQQVNVAPRLHEHLLLEYGSLLMGHRSLWQVGASYLDHCHTKGRACLERILPCLTLDTEARALKIVQVARDRNMNDVVLATCKLMAMKSYQRQRLGNALTWTFRSRDSSMAGFLADKFLQMYCRDSTFQSSDLLHNMGTCMLVSDRLTFLGKYCEFHQLFNVGEYRNAAMLLVELIKAKLAPNFLLTLLEDAVALLESNDIVFNSDDTYELASCLDQLIEDGVVDVRTSCLPKEYPEQENKTNVELSEIKKRLVLIQKVIARNESKAIIHEECL